jgi:hypothetical protein
MINLPSRAVCREDGCGGRQGFFDKARSTAQRAAAAAKAARDEAASKVLAVRDEAARKIAKGNNAGNNIAGSPNTPFFVHPDADITPHVVTPSGAIDQMIVNGGGLDDDDDVMQLAMHLSAEPQPRQRLQRRHALRPPRLLPFGSARCERPTAHPWWLCRPREHSQRPSRSSWRWASTRMQRKGR